MEPWEQRARKLDARRQRLAKHGRSLMTAISDAERKRAAEVERRAALRAARTKQRP